MGSRAALAPAVQLRWQAFAGITVALEQLHGPDALERIRPRLSPELARALRERGDRAREWYPMAWYVEIHDAAQAEFGGGRRLHRDLGRLATEHDLSTAFRFILQFVTPRALLNQSQRVWNLYTDRGVVTTEDLTPTCVRVRFDDCPGLSLPVWEDVTASTAAIVTACGAHSLRHTLVSASAEHGSCVAQYDWAG